MSGEEQNAKKRAGRSETPCRVQFLAWRVVERIGTRHTHAQSRQRHKHRTIQALETDASCPGNWNSTEAANVHEHRTCRFQQCSWIVLHNAPEHPRR